MKKRLILKVLGLLLLLPMFSGCNDTDDVAGIFTGKTWKLTYITKANGHGWYKFADVDDSNIMEYADGKKLTCCGDEPYNECEEKYAVNSTWLLHEAFCLYSQADKFKPYEKHHSTVKDACELAQKLGAENLILYHTEDKNISRRKELYTAEGKPYYNGNLLIPDDLETIEL